MHAPSPHHHRESVGDSSQWSAAPQAGVCLADSFGLCAKKSVNIQVARGALLVQMCWNDQETFTTPLGGFVGRPSLYMKILCFPMKHQNSLREQLIPAIFHFVVFRKICSTIILCFSCPYRVTEEALAWPAASPNERQDGAKLYQRKRRMKASSPAMVATTPGPRKDPATIVASFVE
jgi:predicted Fe-S protein YdhL (DUF1289 family)